MSTPTEIAAKLKFTARALGCASAKELCGRFRAINPATYFDVQRAQKWLQGRAEPRFPQVYEDWAKLLGTARGGGWIASCGLAEFQAELRGRYGPLAETVPVARPAAPGSSRAVVGQGAEMAGSYAVYSMAWSPHFAGRVLRASLVLRRSRTGALSAEYREDLPIGVTIFAGEPVVAGRTLHLPLHDVATGLPLFMSFALPGPPAAVLCGVQCGAALISHEVQPTSGRILLVRTPGAASPEASNRYLAAGESVLADLMALGLPIGAVAGLEALLERTLSGPAGGIDRVAPGEQAALATVFDRVFLGG